MIRQRMGADFSIVTPGIRGGGARTPGKDDQERTLTPAEAIAAGANDLVVVVLYAAQFERWHKGANEALIQLGGEVVASAADTHGLSELIAVPGSVEPAALKAALTKAGASLAQLAEIGSHAERVRVK